MTHAQQFEAMLICSGGNLSHPLMHDAPPWTSCDHLRSTIKFTVWRYKFADGSYYDEKVLRAKFNPTTQRQQP